TDAFRRAYERSRVGADLQLYLDVLPFGATALKGEYIKGKTYLSNGAEQLGRPASGWYALLVQNLGLNNALAIRYDYFDPANGTPAAAAAPGSDRPANTNPTATLGATAIHYFGEYLKASVTYELPMTELVEGVTDPHDNLLTVQFQARF
ncbi:MAG TPA: porin, partial [Archangium sp.]